jgi:hypothetical protein
MTYRHLKILNLGLAFTIGIGAQCLFSDKAFSLACTAPAEAACVCVGGCQSGNCGSFTDLCGNPVNCGACTGPAYMTCGGGGVANVCGCTPVCDNISCGGSDQCGSTCQCIAGQTCTAGSCVADTHFTVAPIVDLGVVYRVNRTDVNNKSFPSCIVTGTITNAAMILQGSPVTPTAGIPVINGGCGGPHGEPGTSCNITVGIFCPATNGMNITSDNTATVDLTLTSLPGAAFNFTCPTYYAAEDDAGNTTTYTCQGDGTWQLSDRCIPMCPNNVPLAPCTNSCSGSGCYGPNICNAGTSNACWFTPQTVCPIGDAFTAGCPADEYIPGGGCPVGYSCSTGPC